MTVIIVPWRDKGDVWRGRNLALVLCHLSSLDIAEVLVVSDGLEGSAPFNRSAAYNRGIALRPDDDVYVFHEADMLIPRSQLLDGIDLAMSRPGMVVPFDTRRDLTTAATEAVHRHVVEPEAAEANYVMADGRSNGACNIVSWRVMEAVGRWDEEFAGWGFDDRAMARAFQVATGTPTRYVPGIGTHLWHRPGWSVESRFRGGARVSPTEQAATDENERRYKRYAKARTPGEVRALTAGG